MAPSAPTVLDADSHLMELEDVLDPFLDDVHRAGLRRETLARMRPLIDAGVAAARRRRQEPDAAAAAMADLLRAKGWEAVGAFDPAERSAALDQLGLAGQLVFATFASTLFLGGDLDLLYAGSRAQNRAVAAFCQADPRLLAVSFVPLADPARAEEAAAEALDLGCAAIMVPSTPAGDRAPSHPDLDRFWGTLERANVPFVLHVGGGGRLLDRRFHDNAMPVTDHLGGGENVRSKDFLAIPHSPEIFLGVLIYDGVFDRFPGLRGGCIEQGAGWVVSWMRHLDHGQRAFRRTEPPLQRLAEAPSSYVRRHLKFTPFPGEDVGWMIEQAGEELFMFSTDYPHPEGGRDPFGRFEAALSGVSDTARRRFFSDNLAELLGGRVGADTVGPLAGRPGPQQP
jgi:predicted TIM-barrel fold metal-dependent hydrolase